MKKIFIMIFATICFLNLLGVAFATNTDELRIEYTMKPEDIHPDGVKQEIGVASFWLQVEAKALPSGEISYEWYVSEDGKLENATLIENEDKSVFIPEQINGTKYYFAKVTAKLGDEEISEYTKPIEATFKSKVIDEIYLLDVVEPKLGEEPINVADRYTDFDLNDYFGYEISKVYWTPKDEKFEEGKNYTINVDVEFWDNVEIAEGIIPMINDKEAKFEMLNANKARISYEFEKLGSNETTNDTPSGNTQIPEENNKTEENKTENVGVNMIFIYILSGITVISLTVSIVVIIKYNGKES